MDQEDEFEECTIGSYCPLEGSGEMTSLQFNRLANRLQVKIEENEVNPGPNYQFVQAEKRSTWRIGENVYVIAIRAEIGNQRVRVYKNDEEITSFAYPGYSCNILHFDSKTATSSFIFLNSSGQPYTCIVLANLKKTKDHYSNQISFPNQTYWNQIKYCGMYNNEVYLFNRGLIKAIDIEDYSTRIVNMPIQVSEDCSPAIIAERMYCPDKEGAMSLYSMKKMKVVNTITWDHSKGEMPHLIYCLPAFTVFFMKFKWIAKKDLQNMCRAVLCDSKLKRVLDIYDFYPCVRIKYSSRSLPVMNISIDSTRQMFGVLVRPAESSQKVIFRLWAVTNSKLNCLNFDVPELKGVKEIVEMSDQERVDSRHYVCHLKINPAHRFGQQGSKTLSVKF